MFRSLSLSLTLSFSLSVCVSLILSLWLRFGLFVFSFFIHSTNRRSYLSNLNLPYIVLLYPFFTLLYDNFSLPCHTFLNSDLYFPFSVCFISPFSNLSNYTMTTLWCFLLLILINYYQFIINLINSIHLFSTFSYYLIKIKIFE